MEKLKSKLLQQNNLPKDVFISYRSTQVEFADRLNTELKNNHIETWFDKDILHENVGERYPELIHEGIDKAKVFLFLYSRDTEESEFIINEEVGYADKIGARIFCYPIDSPDFNNMNATLEKVIRCRQWINRECDAAHCFGMREEIEGEYLRQEKDRLVSENSSPSSIYTDLNLYIIRLCIQQVLGYSTAVGSYVSISKSDSVYGEGELELAVLPIRFVINPSEDKRKRLEDLHFYSPKQANELANKEIGELIEKVQPEEEKLLDVLRSFIVKHYSMEEICDWMRKNRVLYMQNEKDDGSFTVEKFISIVSEIVSDRFIYELDKLGKELFNGTMTGVFNVVENPIPDIERKITRIELYYSDYFTFWCMVEMYHILCTIRDCFQNISRTDIREYSPFMCSLGLGGFIVTNQDDSQKLVWVKRGKAISASSLWHFTYDETSSIYKDAYRDDNKKIKIYEGNIVKLDANHYFYRGMKEEVGITPDMLSPQQGIFELGLIKCDRLEMEILSYAVMDCPKTPSLQMQFSELKRGASDGHNEIERFDFSPLINSTYRYTGRFMTPESDYLSKYLNDNLSNFESQLPCNTVSANVRYGSNIKIGKGCLIEDCCTLGDNCVIGEQCRIHNNVNIGENVFVGNRVKIQNNNSIYQGVTLEDGVFVGTNVSFINDRYPRAIRKDGEPVTSGDWKMEETRVCYGASIGSGAVVMCGVTIGKWAMVAAGSVVLEDVPERTMVAGNPARIVKKDICY